MSALYQFENVHRSFQGPAEAIDIFTDLSFEIQEGESLAIVGASGSGKSTLLYLMGALDTPSSGRILFDGTDLATMTDEEKAYFRNRTLGFVYQFHHLLPEFNAEENVAIPALIEGAPLADVLPRAQDVLRRVGLENRMQAKVSTLSGGERQRVAIARAILQRPRVLLADEPTGNLDEHTGRQIEDLLLNLNHELGTTLVVVTHNMKMAARLDRCLELRSGTLCPVVHASDISSPLR